MIPGLDKLIDAILGIATAQLQDRIQRSEAVIKLLKRLNLDPDHSPADFSSIYQYALVEYGVGKPKPVLDLFRRPEIQQTFRQAFEQSSFPLLEKASHEVIEANQFSNEIQQLGIDWRRELVAFSAVFIGVAKRSRTPAKVFRDQTEQAQQGDPNAIAALMNKSLQLKGITARVKREDNRLEVVVEAERIPNRQTLLAFVEKGIRNLGVEAIDSIQVVGRKAGVQIPVWSHEISVNPSQQESRLQGKTLTKAFIDALIDAFPTRADLEVMVLNELDQQLDAIAQEKNYQTTVYKFIEWAAAHGRLQEVVIGASRSNPENSKLREFISQASERLEPNMQLHIQRQRRQAHQFVEDLGNGVELEMVWIPAGSFVMGSPEDEQGRSASEGPQHSVAVGAFCMGKYPVTQAQWRMVATLPQVNRELKTDPSSFKGDDRPVERISWWDAVEFCDRLSQHMGREYRLPSEAEWEYACRAGTATPFHFGEMLASNLAAICDRDETLPVESFGVANAFGLYDIHGNVWEWCADHWHEDYQGAPIDGSAWLSGNEDSARVLRGGSWLDFPVSCRSAFRLRFAPVGSGNSSGFRVVCSASKSL